MDDRDKYHSKNILYLLLVVLVAGICWILLVELPMIEYLKIINLIGWLTSFFILPLILINFNEKEPFFTTGSTVFALIYTIFASISLINLSSRPCCFLEGVGIIAIALAACLAMFVLGIRDIIERRRSF